MVRKLKSDFASSIQQDQPRLRPAKRSMLCHLNGDGTNKRTRLIAGQVNQHFEGNGFGWKAGCSDGEWKRSRFISGSFSYHAVRELYIQPNMKS